MTVFPVSQFHSLTVSTSRRPSCTPPSFIVLRRGAGFGAGLNSIRVFTSTANKLANIARLKGRQRTRWGQRGQGQQRRPRGEAWQQLGRMRALRGTEKVCGGRRISLEVERWTERIQAAHALARVYGPWMCSPTSALARTQNVKWAGEVRLVGILALKS